MSLIYVKTIPEICNGRVLTRNRPGEDIPIEYLKQCHHYHEKWINTNNECMDVLTLDGDKSISPTIKKDNIKMIKDFINLYIW